MTAVLPRVDRDQTAHHRIIRRVTIQSPLSSVCKDTVKQEPMSPPSISQCRRRIVERHGVQAGGMSISAGPNPARVRRHAISSISLPTSSQSSIRSTELTPPEVTPSATSDRTSSSTIPSTAPFFYHPELKHLSQAFYEEGFRSEEDIVQLMLHSSEVERISVLDGLRASWGINMRDWVRAKRELNNRLSQMRDRPLL